MYRPGTDETNVQMSDVLCDFCHRAWTEDVPFIEGHRGAVICARCLEVAFVELEAGDGPNVVSGDYLCRLSREDDRDREALRRAGEPGWRSPVDPEAVACRKVIRMAAAALQKDPDFDWRKPEVPAAEGGGDAEGGDGGGDEGDADGGPGGNASGN